MRGADEELGPAVIRWGLPLVLPPWAMSEAHFIGGIGRRYVKEARSAIWREGHLAVTVGQYPEHKRWLRELDATNRGLLSRMLLQ